jgi:hypothetical protein
LKRLPENSVDALITDPPAGISFMGKDWDKDKGGRDSWIAWMTDVMTECMRVMKPGAHGLVWAIPRTSHWTGMALENAFVPASRTAIAKLKTCSFKCRDILRMQDPETLKRLRRIASNMKGRKGTQLFGEKNPAWKGGVTYKRSKGNYIGPKYVRCPEPFKSMSRKDGYVMEHRLVMAMHMGRCLTRTEVVHHRDHNTRNNHISNLEYFPTNAEHKRAEGVERRLLLKAKALR